MAYTIDEQDQLVWLAAYTKTQHEKKAAQQLEKLGVEYFLPVQKVSHKWSDRIKVLDKVLIPSMIFIRTTINQRVKLLPYIPDVKGYITTSGPWTPLIIPDYQMDAFKAIVAQRNTEVQISQNKYSPGDKVKILDGPFKDKECEVISIDNKKHIIVRLNLLGVATVEIDDSTKLEVLKQ